MALAVGILAALSGAGLRGRACAAQARPKAKAAKKGPDYEKSKYKDYQVLTQGQYRFDAQGRPVDRTPKKKAAKKAGAAPKKEPPRCSEGEACQSPQ
ncbi:MAG: hypothetical protein HY921_11375 [Elusimicrobia bacterium]|nr:hypothetical protein [Elusimicrobiota bacterium]